MTFEEWAKSKGHPFHDLEPTFNGSKDRYSEPAREAWEAVTLAERISEGGRMTTAQLTLLIIVKILLVPFLAIGVIIGFIYVALNIGFWRGVEYLEQNIEE